MNLRCAYSPELHLLITGSTGFIGKNLIASLYPAKFLPCKLHDVKNSFLIHLAADLSYSRESLSNNVDIDSYVVDYANLNSVFLIYGSSNNVYPMRLDCTTDSKLCCSNYYAASKIFGENLILDQCNINFAILRIADVFGKGQKHGNLFKAIESRLKSRESLELYGTGSKLRSYIYLPELVNIMKFFYESHHIDKSCNSVYNLCYHDALDVAQILKIISDESGLNLRKIELEENTVFNDQRTLISNLPRDYCSLWPSFSKSLLHYVRDCSSSKNF